jgi:hypothetical protein
LLTPHFPPASPKSSLAPPKPGWQAAASAKTQKGVARSFFLVRGIFP